jgi:predicted  nucleic acid-binding Zn-ribbon protein
MATCKCGNEYSDKRKELGYETCLDCGEREAQELVSKKKEQIAPAYNKGPLMFITSMKMVKDLGK